MASLPHAGDGADGHATERDGVAVALERALARSASLQRASAGQGATPEELRERRAGEVRPVEGGDTPAPRTSDARVLLVAGTRAPEVARPRPEERRERGTSDVRLARGRGGAPSPSLSAVHVLVLVTIPFTWATWPVFNAYLLAAVEGAGAPPPPPLALNLGSHTVSFAALSAALALRCAIRARRRGGEVRPANIDLAPARQRPDERLRASADGSGEEGARLLQPGDGLRSLSDSSVRVTFELAEGVHTGGSAHTGAYHTPAGPAARIMALRGGCELGAYVWVGAALQLYAIALTSASRSAFLVQATAMIVPLLQAALLRERVGRRTWWACAVATVGIAILTLGGGEGDSSTSAHTGLGDTLALLAALIYSFHVVRTQRFAQKCDLLFLGWAFAMTEAALSAFAIGAGIAGGLFELTPTLRGVAEAGPDVAAVVCACLVWNGLFPTAYSAWAQGFVQAAVPPARANLVFSSAPLLAAVLAAALLGERLGAPAAVGGLLIVAACAVGSAS